MTFKLHQLLQFLAVAGSIALLAAWFTASQLNSSLAPGSPWRLAVWAASLAIWTFPIFRLLMRGKDIGRFEGLGFYLLGLGATLFAMLLILNLARLAMLPFGHTTAAWAPLAMGGLSLGMTLLGMRTAYAVPELKKVSIRHRGLHPDLEGLKIAQISDLHLNAASTAAEVKALVKRLMEEKPDLIAVTGDLVDAPRHLLQKSLQELEGLKAPLGVHYVTGNHEYFWGAEGLIEDLRGLGFEVLGNEHRVLKRNEATLLVMGVDDPTASRFSPSAGSDLKKALWGAPSSADFRLFLAHQPKTWPLAHAAKSDLMLAGHTHGGQFLPFPGLVSLFHKYFKGLYRHEDSMWVYVSPGTGFWGPPNRLGVPPEITLLELRGA